MREILNAIRRAQSIIANKNQNHWEKVNGLIPTHTAEAKAGVLPVMYKGERMEEDNCDPSYWEVAEEQLRNSESYKVDFDKDFVDEIEDEYYRIIAEGGDLKAKGYTFTPFVK